MLLWKQFVNLVLLQIETRFYFLFDVFSRNGGIRITFASVIIHYHSRSGFASASCFCFLITSISDVYNVRPTNSKALFNQYV